MKYLFLCCYDEDHWEAIPEAERDEIMRAYGAWIEGLERSGQHLASGQLARSSNAVTLRGKSGRPIITDGPFAETKEQLGGYHLVECRDLDEAIAIAERIPTLRVEGTIEVRRVESVS